MVWQKVKLKDVLKQYRITHWVENNKEYKQVTISQTGEVSYRGIKKGINIGRKRQFFIDLKNHPNTLIFIRQGVYKGGIGIAPKEVDGGLVTENMPMFDIVNINPIFLLSYLRSPQFIADVDELIPLGTAQKAVHERQLLEIGIPLPSKKEQEQIVEQLKLFNEKRKILSTDIEKQIDYISKLRQAILRDAVQGKLVNQDPKDEAAIELLKQIKTEKEKLVREGKIRKETPLSLISKDEISYSLPKNWEWTRFQDIYDIRDGTHDTPNYVEDGMPLITSKCFENEKINFELAKKISLKDHKEISKRSLVEKGDILFSMIGGNLGNMVFVDTSKEFSIKNVALFKYYNKNLTPPKYLEIFLKYLSKIIQEKSAGGAQPFIPLKFFRNYLFPLPPLAEQKRIVEKVDKLMAYCDELEKQVKENQLNSHNLTNSVLCEAFNSN
jgi:type I restriction enzyme, S subunit